MPLAGFALIRYHAKVKRTSLFVLRPGAILLLATAQILAQAASSNPNPQDIQRAEQLLASQRYAEAAQAYETLSRSHAGIAEIHARLGLIYFQMGDFTHAVPALRQALKLKPGLPKTDVLLAMSLCELGKYQESLPGLEKGFTQSSDPVLRRMAGLQLQRAFTGLQEDAKAVAIALQMSRLYAQDPEVLYHAGQLFGNYAYVTMRKLSQVAPESVWTIQAIGEANESQGAYGVAIAKYRQVIALAPRRPGIHFRLGRSLLLRSQQNDAEPGDAAAAVEEFQRELELDPTNSNTAYELGVIFYGRGEHAKAHEAFTTALKHAADFQEAEVGLGRTLLALNRDAEAVPHLQRAAQLNPDDDIPHYQLSRAYKKLGNEAAYQKAAADFKRLREARSQRETVIIQRAVTRQEVDSDAKQQ